jgi:hypothetical protein
VARSNDGGAEDGEVAQIGGAAVGRR